MGEYESEDVKCFEMSMKQTVDLLLDSYKWKKLSQCNKNPETQQKYRQISEMLYSTFLEEHKRIMDMYKKD